MRIIGSCPSSAAEGIAMQGFMVKCTLLPSGSF
jgi:hypothetical protein